MGPFLETHAGPMTRRDLGQSKWFELSGGPVPTDVLITGPGVFNTVHGLTCFLEQTRMEKAPFPDLILDTGIAGVFQSSGLDIGDAALADCSRYIHTGVDNGDPVFAPLPFDLIPGRPETGQGLYRPDPEPAGACARMISDKLGQPVARGLILTVSAVTGTPQKAEQLFQGFSGVMEAMEGAAAAHTAALYNIPLVEIRAGSNWVGDRDKARWDIPGAVRMVARICRAIREYMEAGA